MTEMRYILESDIAHIHRMAKDVECRMAIIREMHDAGYGAQYAAFRL